MTGRARAAGPTRRPVPTGLAFPACNARIRHAASGVGPALQAIQATEHGRGVAPSSVMTSRASPVYGARTLVEGSGADHVHRDTSVCTAFVNLIVIFSSTYIQRHWNGRGLGNRSHP